MRIPASEFQAGGDLAGSSPAPARAAPTPDLDEPVDENGIDNPNPAINGISSMQITLAVASEPDTAVDGNGPNSNLTLDFGFVKHDLALRKTVAASPRRRWCPA